MRTRNNNNVKGTVSLDKQPRFLRITIGSRGYLSNPCWQSI